MLPTLCALRCPDDKYHELESLDDDNAAFFFGKMAFQGRLLRHEATIGVVQRDLI